MTKTCVAVFAVVMAVSQAAQAKGPLPADWKVDRSLYPRAYGVLANERLMFPVDMSDWPVKIGSSRQLFVDDYLVASTDGITRQVHQATKHPANPLITGDTLWERNPAYHVVRYDPTRRLFRMWYTGWSWHKGTTGKNEGLALCYAESVDGVRWTTPKLGIHEYNGSKDNNVLLKEAAFCGLIIDPKDPDPNRRYKAVVWLVPRNVPREAFFLYTSPDGIRWTRALQEPLALHSRSYSLPLDGIGDTSIFRWDRLLGRYICDVKFVIPPKMRCRGSMESDDLMHWSRPRMTVHPDGLDEADSQIYGHLSFCYEDMWLAFLRVMHTKRTGWKQTTVELTASRDGRHWSRVARREVVLPLGGPKDWDPDYNDPYLGGPILVGDELWIYYRGAMRRNRVPKDKWTSPGNYKWAIGLAKLRRDGFVSLNAGAKVGRIVTRPLTFAGGKLHVNAQVAPGGYIKVGLQSESGKAVKPYSSAACRPVAGDVLAAPVVWRGAETIKPPAGAMSRLVFEMKNAKLYSFWIE